MRAGSLLPSLLFYGASHHNILPLTSRCNLSCIFCSHRQNPPGTHAYHLPELKPSQVVETFSFLSPREKIIIGESASKIMEGEPFCYPYIREVLTELRREFPHTPLQITTNGSLLEEPTLDYLSQIKPLEMVISLNISTPSLREKFLGDRHPQGALNTIKSFKRFDIGFHGSVVALPHLTGWEELKKTLFFLEKEGARTLRLFLPGFTQLAPSSLVFDPSLWKELGYFVEDLREVLTVPLLLEPPYLKDLDARVEGVIKDTPGDKAGLREGDIILAAGNKRIKSRKEAFQRVCKEKSPLITFTRGEEEKRIRLEKGAGESPGFVVYQDMDEYTRDRFLKTVENCRKKRTLVMTSLLAFSLINGLVEDISKEGDQVKVVSVPNSFFGGSIMSAGLLVVQDFLKVIEAEKVKPRVIILPEDPFDFQGKDLRGHSYLRIQEETGASLFLM